MKLITVCTGIPYVALSERSNDNYDENWNYLSFFAFYKNTGVQIEKLEQMDQMISLFERLAEGIPQVRVDAYINEGRILFGEMTFYKWNGFIEFTPSEWDRELGEWIVLLRK